MKYANIIYKEGDKIQEVFFIMELPTSLANRRALFLCKCGKSFEATMNNVKTGQVKSCGCAFINRINPRKKEMVKTICACGCKNEFINIDNKGRKRLFIHGHNKGHNKPHTKQAKLKMGLKHIGKIIPIEQRYRMGSKKEKNPNWKGGVTSINETIRKSIEYKLWREAVFQRDNYTCVCCGEKEKVSGKLEADHIRPFAYFPELRFLIDNGRTLCKVCHKQTDTYLWKCNLKHG